MPNNTICAKATVGDFSEEGEKMLLALALYRGEMLEEVQVDSKVCGENTNYSVSITLPENLDNCSVKAFLWDSNSLTGICLCAVLPDHIIAKLVVALTNTYIKAVDRF